jgi:predicted adenylyl cyclase CyaB
MCRAEARRYMGKPMQGINLEFKARMRDEKRVRAALKSLRPRVAGTDHQIDTYFNTPSGRLKIRQGNIENALIFYQRQNTARVRPSKVLLCEFPDPAQVRTLKKVLAAALGVAAVVDKVREIYFVDNIKIHLDRVRGLGKFLEVEAFVHKGNLRHGRKQAEQMKEMFGVLPNDILSHSYSDLIIEHRGKRPPRRR